MVRNVFGESTLLLQGPSFVQLGQCIDTVANGEDEVIFLIGRRDNRFHRGHQTGVQGSLSERTEPAAWGLGVFLFLFLPLAGEYTSDRGLSVCVDSEWEIYMDMGH